MKDVRMYRKLNEKTKAIALRKAGNSYSEILKQVPVAKSTLSLWLRDVGLAKRQIQKLTEKRMAGQARGAAARRSQRIESSERIKKIAREEIGTITRRELWLIGIALYWAEGHKEKEYYPGSPVRFSNSDPLMINLYLKWLDRCCGVKEDRIKLTIYIHSIYLDRLDGIKKYWSKVTDLSLENFETIYIKRHNILTNRKKVGNVYNGGLSIIVKESSSLNRKIAGWVSGIVEGI